MLSAPQKGKIAVPRVWQRAIAKGWIVSWPTTDCRYDLVLDDGDRLYRVQVKDAGRQASNCQGAVSLDLTKGGKRNRTYPEREIDAVIVHVAPADALVWLDPERFHQRRSVQLRDLPTRSGQQNGCLLVSDVSW